MKNHFETFELPAKFHINLDKLEQKFFTLQNQFHPDKSSIGDIEKSIAINEAYKILSDDFNRACYLLFLSGIDIKNDETAIKPDFSTLEEVLALQEKIAEIADENEIAELRKTLGDRIKLLIELAVNSFESSKINDSAQLLVKAKYLKKSLEDLKNRKRKI